jgi:GntR family transcriptional regulator
VIFHIDFKAGKPVYLQLVDQVKTAAATGALRAGESLPSIRPLAEQLRVNRNTIARAYAELEAHGIIDTMQGRGSVLRPNQSSLKKEARRKVLADALDAAVIQAHHTQTSRDEFLALAEERFDALERRRARAAQEKRP